MCKAERKLEAFRYILTRFVAHQRVLTPASSDVEVFNSFSNKRLMKLLYLLCLESVPYEGLDEIGLFKVFDNMIAYPYGPVEQDVYDGLWLIKGVEYKDGKFESLPNEDNGGDIEHELQCSIDTAFDKLVDRLGNTFLDTERLINIVHSLYLWPKTYVSSSDKSMDVNNKDELIKEKNVYKQIVSKSA